MVKEYSKFTEDERGKTQKIWESVLESYCHADSDGCHPCDYGTPCDKCQYDRNLNRKYADECTKAGLPISTGLAETIKD